MANITRHEVATRIHNVHHTRLPVKPADSGRVEIQETQANAGVTVEEETCPETSSHGLDQHHDSRMK